jgi:hypothetical protein
MVYGIELDRATGTLWMLKTKDVFNELWKLPIAGGKLERVPGEQAYVIYVRAPKQLEDGPPEALAKAAAAARPRLREVVGRERRAGVQQLRILRGGGARVGWTFANGKLTEGEPRDE